MRSYKRYFSRFLDADPDRIHFAAHSHHYWPDVSFDAHQQAWLDAARLADRKWDRVFGEIWPKAQAHVARILNLPDPATIVFAPSTHDFVLRLLSCLPADRTPRILTTDGEFHSFSRQTARLAEDGLVRIEQVATRPFDSFAARFQAAAARGGHDLIFLSQVFFDSGFAVSDLQSIATAADPSTLVAIDGYHGFLTVPTDLSPIADRVFYMGGGYKYAMSGEGACFLHVPPGYGPRPRDTGWFAAFGALSDRRGGPVGYGAGAARFLGATFDPTALYRFNAVMDWLADLGLDAAAIQERTRTLQQAFTAELDRRPGLPFTADQLVVPLAAPDRGQFLTFETPRAAEIHRSLMDANLYTDVRGDRLRFGFALYHDPDDIPRAVARMARSR